ncbi:MAG: type II toxin-antitoxin system VapC family toxin [Rhizomicrobium sp.]|jgi:predicted nucleic-acid-binding protein
MIGLDTNVLVRLFVEDEPKQTRLAARFIGDHCSPADPGFVDRIALCETVWVLTSAYDYSRSAVARVVRQLVASADILLEDAELVEGALSIYEQGSVDLSDVLMTQVNLARGCTTTVTFDRKAARLDGVTLIS